MREEFLEPLPEVRKKATLLMANVPVACFVVSATMCEFRVAVPGIEQYEGDPRLTLVTSAGVYPVRIIRQEAHSGGYSYRLQRLDLLEQAVPAKVPAGMHSQSRSTPVRATCVLAIALGSWVCVHAMSDEIGPPSIQGRLSQMTRWGSSAVKHEIGPSIVRTGDQVAMVGESTPVDDDAIGDMPSIAVSMVSTGTSRNSIPSVAQVIAPDLGFEDANQAGMQKTLPRTISLKSVLEAGQSGGVQNLSRYVAPWLFGDKGSERLQQIRITDAAIRDLQQFESGLRSLPSAVVRDAICSLNRTLISASVDIRGAERVAGISDYRRISSGDANLYFRIVHGQTELVRVLPIEFNRAE